MADVEKRYWLMKSEPDVFSIDDLENQPDQTEYWDGVRNYQARNFMRDQMKPGDEVLFYHSNCKPPGIAGIAEVAGPPVPDHTSWDKNSKYFDPRSSPENPRWCMVPIRFVEKFKTIISLQDLKDDPGLDGILVTKRGQRLSIQPVQPEHFLHIKQHASTNA